MQQHYFYIIVIAILVKATPESKLITNTFPMFLKFLWIFLLPFTVFSQTDNSELQKMYDDDQSSRIIKNIDWTILSKQDREREKRVYELIKSGQIVTAKDHYNSAMIFQHGGDTLASSMAVKQMRKAIELDTTINRWLLAAAIDRDLMRREKPQIYGTQFVKNNGDSKWTRYTIDTSKVTDNERKHYNVETLAEQVVKERNMNLLPISEFHATAPSIQKTIAFIIAEKEKGLQSEYNTTEDEINSFGYELLSANKESEALAVFTLNTKLYPDRFNTFDSLGECLLLLGKSDEGIKAYRKSLQLNPNNDNAKKVLSSRK